MITKPTGHGRFSPLVDRAYVWEILSKEPPPTTPLLDDRLKSPPSQLLNAPSLKEAAPPLIAEESPATSDFDPQLSTGDALPMTLKLPPAASY